MLTRTMLRFLHLGIALFVATPAHAASFDPAQYMPEEAFMVMRIANPSRTLASAEALAAAAGLAPPGAPSGWILSTMGENTGLTNIDLAQPIWVAMILPKGAGAEDPFEASHVIAVAKAKGKASLQALQKTPNAKVIQKSGWVLGTNGDPRLLKPRPKPFRFMASTQTLQARTDVVAYIDYEYLAAMQTDPEARKMLDATGMADTKITLGAGLAADGLNVYIQQHPDFSTPLGQSMKAAKNVKGGLLKGLPPANYGVLYGAKTDTGQSAAIAESMQQTLGQIIAEMMPEMKNLSEKIMDVAKSDEGKCGSNTMGIGIPSDPSSAFMVMSSTCKDAKKAVGTWHELTGALNEFIKGVNEKENSDIDFSLALDEPRKQFGTTLTPVRLVVPKDRQAEMPTMMQQPLLLGAVDKTHMITSWNASPKLLSSLVNAAKKGAKPALSAFAGTRKKLLSPRLLEGYVNVGALATPFLTAEMAPIKFAVNAAPPLGMATQRQSDGSWLTQIHIPQQFAQLGAMALQVFSAL